jgi:hypothetical protein
MDDQAALRDGVGLGVPGNLGADNQRPHPPEIVLTNPTFQTQPLQGGR